MELYGRDPSEVQAAVQGIRRLYQRELKHAYSAYRVASSGSIKKLLLKSTAPARSDSVFTNFVLSPILQSVDPGLRFTLDTPNILEFIKPVAWFDWQPEMVSQGVAAVAGVRAGRRVLLLEQRIGHMVNATSMDLSGARKAVKREVIDFSGTMWLTEVPVADKAGWLKFSPAKRLKSGETFEYAYSVSASSESFARQVLDPMTKELLALLSRCFSPPPFGAIRQGQLMLAFPGWRCFLPAYTDEGRRGQERQVEAFARTLAFALWFLDRLPGRVK